MAENQKIFEVRKIKIFDEETEYFEKKTLLFFKKASLPK